MLQSLTPQVDAFDIVVLGSEATVVTAPFHFSIKTKVGKEIKSQGVYSAVVQLRAGRWRVVQSHESELNIAELMAAMAPPKPKK
jgi:ketosteroid isomerase-like protein